MNLEQLKQNLASRPKPKPDLDLRKLTEADQLCLYGLAALYVAHRNGKPFFQPNSRIKARSPNLNQLRSVYFHVVPGDYKKNLAPIYTARTLEDLPAPALELLEQLIENL